MYSKEVVENKRQRVSLLQATEQRAFVMKKCENDPLFFFNMLLWTYDPREANANIPFITWEYQDSFIRDVINDIENDRDIFIEKSRDMGFSWLMLGIFLWGFIFKKRSLLIGSYKQDYVDTQGNMDSAFERLRYMIERLPDRILPEGMQSKFMLINGGGGEIAGDSGENFGTGGRRKAVLFDEFSYWQHAKTALRKSRDVTRCRIIGGTPNGRFNPYGQIGTYSGTYGKLLFKRYRLLRSMHPKKTMDIWDEKTQSMRPWYEVQKNTRTPLEMATEIDISYDNSVEGAVYKDFNNKVKLGQYKYNPAQNFKTFASFDFGRDMNAMQVWQTDIETDQDFCIFAVQKKDRYIDKFMAFVNGKPTQGEIYDVEEMELINQASIWANRYSGLFGDPYNSSSKTTNTKSSIEDRFKAFGYHLTWKRDTTVEERITKAQLSLTLAHINEDLTDLLWCLTQAHYPNEKEDSQATSEKTKPVHDETSHHRTCFEYWYDNKPKIIVAKKKEKRIRTYKDPWTGVIKVVGTGESLHSKNINDGMR